MEQRNARANGMLGRVRLRRAQTIDLTVDAFRSLGWGLLRQAALPTLYVVAVNFFIERFILTDFFSTEPGATLQRQMWEVAARLALLFFVAAPLLVIGVSYLFGVATVMVSDWVGGLIPDSEAAGGRALQVLPKAAGIVFRQALGVLLAYGFCVGLLAISAYMDSSGVTEQYGQNATTAVALIGFIASSMYLAYQWISSALVVPVAVIEGGRGKEIARRSRLLLSAQTPGGSGQWEMIKLLLTLFFVELAMQAGISTLYELFGLDNWIRQLFGTGSGRQIALASGEFLLSFLVLWIALSFGAVGRAVLYFDRRVRLEGFEVELMARAAWRAEKRARFEL